MRLARARDRGQGDLPLHIHRAVEEEGQVILGEIEDAPLGLAEVADEAEVDGVKVVALADGPGVQVLGKRLARLGMFGQPVAGARGRQGIGQGRSVAFQFRVLFGQRRLPRLRAAGVRRPPAVLSAALVE